jgi:IS5 family transposase
VVNTDIPHPSDSTLLGDGVRVLCRTLKKAKSLLGSAADLGRDALRDRTRSARRQVKRILEAARQRGQQAEQNMHSAYQKLIKVTTTVLGQAQQAAQALRQQASQAADNLLSRLCSFIPRVEQVIEC